MRSFTLLLAWITTTGLCLAAEPASGKAASPAGETGLWQPYRITPRSGAQHVSLDGPWQLGHRDEAIAESAELDKQEQWITADVPSSVQWALYRAGKLPHPYEHLNSKQYSWVDEKVWYYRKSVELPAAVPGRFVFVAFDGIDYFARVWFNGKLLGRHEGMFGGPVAEVGALVRPGKPNEIVVEVRAANFGNKKDFKSRKLGPIIKPWVLAGGVGAEMFFPLGMWRGGRIEIVPGTHIERPVLVTEAADEHAAQLRLSLEVFDGSHSLQYELHPWKNTAIQPVEPYRNAWQAKPGTAKLSLAVRLEDKANGTAAVEQTTVLDTIEGRNAVRQSLRVPRPKLWWPNRMGDPHLYRVKLALLSNGTAVDRIEFDYGIRTIESRPTPGRPMPDRWANWQFVVNGQPFFVKGVNWMPADILLDLPAERYRWLLGMAKAAGVQLIRVWGGGLLETEQFYAACNELGLMVWQDFPVGNQDTPDWPQDVWEAQVMQNIYRLRNHPALVLYCGGNEFNPYSVGNTATIGIIERAVAGFDPTRLWRRTTPDEGSLHVYPNMDPTWYASAYRWVPYIAETGMHNIPDPQSILEMVDPAEFARPLSGMLDKAFPKQHPELMHHFVEYAASRVPQMLGRASHIDDMNAPTLEALSEGTQIGAGEFYQIVSDVTQANWPTTTGLMPWVFKRPWPVIAIMLVDGLGHPTAPYYFLKRTYEPTHALVRLPHLVWGKSESLPVRAAIVHAPPAAAEGMQLGVRVLDPTFQTQWEQKRSVNLQPGPSVTDVDLGQFTIPEEFEERFFFVVAELRTAAERQAPLPQSGEGNLLSRSVYWPCCLARMNDEAFRTKCRAAPQAPPTLDKGPWLKPQVAAIGTRLEASLTESRDMGPDRSRLAVRVRNTGSYPAVNVRFDVSGTKRSFFAADNFFWLAPGEERTLEVQVLWRDPATRAKARLSTAAWNAAAIEFPVVGD